MEGRYRGLLEAAPDAMVVVNQAGRIVLLNLQAEKQFGYHRDELVGQPVTNIIPEGFAERLIADDLRSTEDALAQVIGTGIELTAKRKDGTEFPIEIMLSPLGSTDGILVTAAIRDISVRKAAERHVVQMEARYRGLLEAAPDAMVVVNQAGRIVLLNLQAEKQFGYHRDELVGQPVTNIIPEGFAERLIADDRRSTEDALAQVIGTGLKLYALRKDGSEFPIEIMLSPLDSTDGILVTAAIRDISVRRAADRRLFGISAELERSNRELQDFATIASHDLQEPLRKIQAFGDRLRERSSRALDDESRDYLARMTGAADRMQSLINDLLEYSQVSLRPEPPQPVDIGRVVAEVVSDLDERIRTTGGTVLVEPMPTILAYPLQMRQLFQNLIANALKFHAPGVAPVVRISAERRTGHKRSDLDSGWQIRVRDNGIGFDKKYAEKIFAPFQRLHGRQTFEGTGMGLAICRRITALHGGTLTAEVTPGMGATFVVGLRNSPGDQDTEGAAR
jgi:PAS domain S-box-containing protein